MRKVFILAVSAVALIMTTAFCMDLDVMMPMLAKSKQGINGIFSSIDKDLSKAAKDLSSLDLKGEAARKILNGLCKGKSYVVDSVIVDTNGKMIVVEPPEYSKYENSDISRQSHVISLLKNKKPCFTDVFFAVEGIEVIVFVYPVFSEKNELRGSVNMVVKQDALADDIVMPLVKDKPCKIWIMQKDGAIIYDLDPAQIGRNIFKDELYALFQDLVSFSRTVAMTKEGAGSYGFYAKGLEDKTVVKKYAVWDTVSLYGTEWRIIAMEADKPVPVEKDAATPQK